jgi:peptidyl-prolyl cis-trans isomerase SurA
MKLIKILSLILLITVSFSRVAYSAPEIIEKIYAVVNGEVITYSEVKNSEIELTRMLRRQFQGQELDEKIAELKKNLLNQLIDQKIVLSVAKEKNYDVDHEVEMIIKDLKKQNNIKSDEELKNAITSQGLDYDQWRKQLKETSLQHRLIREEVGYKINIDNSEIMEYYREHMKEYTKPMELSLNCIYLEKEKHMDPTALTELKQTIDTALKEKKFEDTAKEYSELPGTENNYFLGNFKQGELDAKIEETALKLEKGKHSDWLETDTGWYIIQLVSRTEPELVEYKTVRNQIENTIRSQKQDAQLKEYVKQLKKDCYIKIYEEYK